MIKQIENYILTGFWVLGLLLAGADGPLCPLINLTGAGFTLISSWIIYNRTYLSDVVAGAGHARDFRGHGPLLPADSAKE